jgi:hypothetical protein
LVPQDRHGSDGLESDVRIIAVHQAQHALPEHRRTAAVVGQDLQDELSGTGARSGEAVVSAASRR